MSGRSFNVTIIFIDRLRPLTKRLNCGVHILSPVTENCLLESAEGETKYVAGRF